MVTIAGSLSAAGQLGALNVAIVDVQVPVKALFESVRPYPAGPGDIGLLGAGLAKKEAGAEQAFPIDIFSVIAEIQRSIDRLSERTASISELYTYYTPAWAGAHGPAYVWQTGGPATVGPGEASGEPPEGLPSSVIRSGELAEPREKPAWAPDSEEDEGFGRRKEPAAAYAKEPSSSVSDLDHEVRQSGLAVEQLKGDFLSVTRDLAGIEAMIEEIVRLSLAGNVDVNYMAALETLPVRPVPGAPAAEAPYVEPRLPELVGRDKSPVERPDMGEAKQARISGPPEFIQGLARGANLSKTLWGSTIETTSLLEAVTREIIYNMVARAPAAESLLKVDEYLKQGGPGSPGAGTVEAPGKDQTAVTPFYSVAPAMAQGSPIVQTIETYNTIVNVVKASEVASGIMPTRNATRAEITHYLLSMPGQPADDRQMKALLDLVAALQANVSPAVLAAAPLDLPADMSVLSDILDLRLAVRALQDAYASLRGAVPSLADIIGLQKAVEGMPAAAAVPGDEAAAPRLSIAIEGVKTAGASVDLPDFSLVTDQFRQMQTMMARLQVPMYGEGGEVKEPTLAFVAESGPEVIVSGEDFEDFTGQIASLNNNYASIWADVLVLRDAIKEMVGSVNDALGSVGGSQELGSVGGSQEPPNFVKEYVGLTEDVLRRMADTYLGHAGLSFSDIENIFTSTGAGVFKATVGSGAAVALNVLDEKLFGEGEKEKEKESKGEDGDGDAEDKEEEEFWDLMDKIDTISTIRNKRQGKFE